MTSPALATALFSGLLLWSQPARSQNAIWHDAGENSAEAPGAAAGQGSRGRGRLYALDQAALRSCLGRAPKESRRGAADSGDIILLPRPDGTSARFRFVEAPVMAPGLAARFPQIKTYVGRGLDEPGATVRFDLTPAGFHAQVLSPNGSVFIHPGEGKNTRFHVCYNKREARAAGRGFECLVPDLDAAQLVPSLQGPQAAPAAVLRTYRLACAATGEYTAYHGGSVAAGLAAIVTAINEVTGVLETDLGIRLELVENNDLLIYTNAAADPYKNGDAWALVSGNQSNVDRVIGAANYDIGHVFSTAGGGLAVVGSVCANGLKAHGETGMTSPVGDAFYVDYVLHEIGHQLGANHSFNGAGGVCGANRYAASAYEPGSGSTIMGYAGICGVDNLQAHSDAYFHSRSIEEILSFTTAGTGGACGTPSVLANTAPSVSAAGGFTIPQATPFSLAASGADADGDTLTYCWEERDLGPQRSLGAPDNQSSPLFRSFPPVTDPVRTFPRLATILAGGSSAGEQLPVLPRVMQFRVTARDNHPGGGASATADVQLTVASNAGPFIVTAPGGGTTWSNVQTVTWSVAGTFDPPVNAQTVNILLSTNSGLAFPFVLAANVPNNGACAVTLPPISCANCRILVEAASNVFFNINSGDFTIQPSVWPPFVALDSISLTAESGVPANGRVDPGETVMVQIALKNTGDLAVSNLVATLLETNGIVSPGGTQSYGLLAGRGAAVARPFVVLAAGACGDTLTAELRLQDGETPLPPILIPIPLGSVQVVTRAFVSPQPITILDHAAASPYPAAIPVSGMSGTITHVTVTLHGVSHSWPQDIGALLVGPGGRKALLMANAGGSSSLSGVTLTLDDTAATVFPEMGPITSGSYRPAAYDGGTEGFVAPAPAGPYDATLSVFNGVNPNGDWSLFIQDNYGGDAGVVAGGWTLTLTSSEAVCCTNIAVAADLALGVSSSPVVASQGELVNCTLIVTNLGLGTAGNVIVSGNLPAGAGFVSASASQGVCTSVDGVFTASLGTVAYGVLPSINLVLTAVEAGSFTNAFTVRSATADPEAANNSVPLLVTIRPVMLRPPPETPVVKSITLTANGVRLTWSAVQGQAYRVQYTESLPGTNWIDLAPDVKASGAEAAVNDPAPAGPGRFYRIWALP